MNKKPSTNPFLLDKLQEQISYVKLLFPNNNHLPISATIRNPFMSLPFPVIADGNHGEYRFRSDTCKSVSRTISARLLPSFYAP